MTTKCPSCSQSSGERSNPQVEAWNGEAVSRNASKLDSASLRLKVGVTNLPYWLKSATGGEVTFICTRQTPRGGWRQRAAKEKSRNLRDPQPTIVLSERESDGLIVAKKGLTILERRGLTVSAQRLKRHATA
jgi:hypothetical protein